MSAAIPPIYRVSIEAHEVAGRWRIPAADDLSLPASSPGQAVGFAVRAAHARAGVPPWRPWVRVSEDFTTATLDEPDPLGQLHREADDDQPRWRA